MQRTWRLGKTINYLWDSESAKHIALHCIALHCIAATAWISEDSYAAYAWHLGAVDNVCSNSMDTTYFHCASLEIESYVQTNFV